MIIQKAKVMKLLFIVLCCWVLHIFFFLVWKMSQSTNFYDYECLKYQQHTIETELCTTIEQEMKKKMGIIYIYCWGGLVRGGGGGKNKENLKEVSFSGFFVVLSECFWQLYIFTTKNPQTKKVTNKHKETKAMIVSLIIMSYNTRQFLH